MNTTTTTTTQPWFPPQLLRRARRMIELGYTDPALDLGATAACYAHFDRATIAHRRYEEARESLRELARAPGELLFEAFERIEREIDAELRNVGWEALRAQIGDVAKWSPERIARYADALERQCETRAAAAFEDAAYGRDR